MVNGAMIASNPSAWLDDDSAESFAEADQESNTHIEKMSNGRVSTAPAMHPVEPSRSGWVLAQVYQNNAAPTHVLAAVQTNSFAL